MVVSQCLELAACRYNAQAIRAPFITALGAWAELRPVCPEVAIGLGIPRDPIRLVQRDRRMLLVQPTTGRDLTETMERFAQGFLDQANDVDGFILKSRSPSCGIKDTKVYAAADGEQPGGRGAGLFGHAVLERFPHAAVEDEGRLTNFRLRHHFLVKLYMRARYRAVEAAGDPRGLIDFQTRHKLQLMAFSQTGLRALGRIVAQAGAERPEALFAAYRDGLGRALDVPARTGSIINVLQHAFGYFSDELASAEKRHFLQLLEQFSQRMVTLAVPLALLQSWTHRFGQEYLAGQTFLDPYPQALMDLHDTGKE